MIFSETTFAARPWEASERFLRFFFLRDHFEFFESTYGFKKFGALKTGAESSPFAHPVVDGSKAGAHVRFARGRTVPDRARERTTLKR